jgi:HK97 family phage prohead protease
MTETTRVAFPIEWRTVSVDERIVEGLGVPWGEVSYLTPDPAGERFLPGSLTKSVREKGARLKLFRAHDHSAAIGRAVKLDARHPDGLMSSWRIFKTPAGNAALEEIAEGALDSFSLGFMPKRTQRAPDGVREVVEAELHEVSIAPIGAYDGARVLSMRTPASELDRARAWLQANPAPVVCLTPLRPLRS